MAASAKKTQPIAPPAKEHRLTWEQVGEALEIYHPGLGRKVTMQIAEWSRNLFDDAIEPMPLVLARPSVTHGHWAPGLPLAGQGRMYEPEICDARLRDVKPILRVRKSDLLRGVLQKYAKTLGGDAKAGGELWCKGVMRAHYKLTGEKIWASPQTSKTIEPIGERNIAPRRIVMVQEPSPKGDTSLPIDRVLSWPVNVLPDLGFIEKDTQA